jgi:hypothetical protein
MPEPRVLWSTDSAQWPGKHRAHPTHRSPRNLRVDTNRAVAGRARTAARWASAPRPLRLLLQSVSFLPLPLRGREASASIECSAQVVRVGREDIAASLRRRHTASAQSAGNFHTITQQKPWRWGPEAAMGGLASLIAVLASCLVVQTACELCRTYCEASSFRFRKANASSTPAPKPFPHVARRVACGPWRPMWRGRTTQRGAVPHSPMLLQVGMVWSNI